MSGGVTSSYVYDRETSGVTTTVYPSALLRASVGAYFEWTGSTTTTMKSYYYGGGTLVAMRTGVTGTVNCLLGDHLGSTALTLDSAGNRLATNTELRYFRYGVARYTAGAPPPTFNFTGQRGSVLVGSGLRDAGLAAGSHVQRRHRPVLRAFVIQTLAAL